MHLFLLHACLILQFIYDDGLAHLNFVFNVSAVIYAESYKDD